MSIQNRRKRPNSKGLPEIKSLEKYIQEYIIGQDDHVRSIITAIYRARQLKSIKSNVLVVGKSGTGKTETLKQIAKKLNIAHTVEDATKYTEEGYYGADVDEMVQHLFENSGYKLRHAEQGMLIIDEIDKKATRGDIIGRDSSGISVLKSLLKLVEGTKVKVYGEYDEEQYNEETYYFDTSNLIVFFLGAFSELDEIRKKRLGKGTIGFGRTEATANQFHRYIKKDLIEYGIPEEFAGRIDTIIEMNNLTELNLVEILKRSRLSVFKKYQSALRQKGITLKYDPELFKAIAKEAMAVDTGARELSNTVNYIFEKIIYDVFANDGKFKICKPSLEIVKDNSKYVLE